MKKYYLIDGNLHCLHVVCESRLRNGNVCYLATDSKTNEEVWLYPNKGIIEFCNRNHKIVRAREVSETATMLGPYDYIWGGEVRDKRSNSMCARPFFLGGIKANE